MFQFIDYVTKKFCEGEYDSKFYIEDLNQELKNAGQEEIGILEVTPGECKNISKDFTKTDIYDIKKMQKQG